MDVSIQLPYSWGRSQWCPMNRRRGGNQSWSRHFGKQKSSFPLVGIEPLFLSYTANSPISKPNDVS